MGIELIFNGVIDLPKSEYFFTLRVMFWQAFFTALSIVFVSIDTATNDIIECVIASIIQETEKIMVVVGGLFCPRVAYA